MAGSDGRSSQEILKCIANHDTPSSSKEVSNSRSPSCPLDSGNASYELIPQTPIKPTDEHLIEFADALRTVAMTLRRVAEGKAAAQAEAAEWKQKYELERERNQKAKVVASKGCSACNNEKPESEYKSNHVEVNNPDSEQSECGENNGMCCQNLLQDKMSIINLRPDHKFVGRKASFRLMWGFGGTNNKQQKHDFVSFEKGDITMAERTNKQILLRWETSPQNVLIVTKPNSRSVRALCSEIVRWLRDRNVNVYVEPRVSKELMSDDPQFNFIQTWEDDNEIKDLHKKVDLVITLGGDGTVLWAASLFKGPVPPVVAFALGSLGFMTPFQSELYPECLENILKGPFSITLRKRLQCRVIRECRDEAESDDTVLVLNELTIDRGISSYLTYLECYCDGSFVTTVQGDGLIISTTSGSTAYSLAAGGSMVHPQVPGILFTPICPHSLSFRPLILPEHVTLRIQVPTNSRGAAWASFDGKDRKQISPGDALICSIFPCPVPTACMADSTTDFLRSVHEGLHWNIRKSQLFDGPHL